VGKKRLRIVTEAFCVVKEEAKRRFWSLVDKVSITYFGEFVKGVLPFRGKIVNYLYLFGKLP
jgi:hypothetical protein